MGQCEFEAQWVDVFVTQWVDVTEAQWVDVVCGSVGRCVFEA